MTKSHKQFYLLVGSIRSWSVLGVASFENKLGNQNFSWNMIIIVKRAVVSTDAKDDVVFVGWVELDVLFKAAVRQGTHRKETFGGDIQNVSLYVQKE